MVKVLFFRFRVTNSMGALLFSHIRVTSMKLINEKNLLNYCSFKMTWPALFCYVFCTLESLIIGGVGIIGGLDIVIIINNRRGGLE